MTMRALRSFPATNSMSLRPFIDPWASRPGRRPLFALAVAALAACGSDGPSDPDTDAGNDVPYDVVGDPMVEIGTGFPDFEPLTDGQEVSIIQGIQGGYHIWGGLRASGLDPRDIHIRFEVVHEGTVVALADYDDNIDYDGPVNADEVAGGAAPIWEYAAVAVIFGSEETRNIESVTGVDVTMNLSLTDQRGVTATDSISLRTTCCEL